jgi:hypothetical protein
MTQLKPLTEEEWKKRVNPTEDDLFYPSLDDYFNVMMKINSVDEVFKKIAHASVEAFINELADNGWRHGFPRIERQRYNREFQTRLMVRGLADKR